MPKRDPALAVLVADPSSHMAALVAVMLRSIGIRSVDEIEQSGRGWTFAKLTIANMTIRDLAASAA